MKTKLAAVALLTIGGAGLFALPAAATPEVSHMSAATQTREVPGVHEVAAVPRGATACYKVTTASLRIREAPNNNAKIVGFLKQGQIVRASTTVTVGFRELGPHRWSGSKFLAAVNAHC